MASMKDVARMAGVSVSTVSRVINSSLPVEERTRSKVEKAISETGYKPNLIARGLRVKSSNLIGMLLPEIRSTSFSTLIEMVERSVEALGYNLIIGGTGGDPDREERFFEDLIRRHVDGVIISRVSDRSHIYRIIDRTNVPIVVVDRPFERENIPTVVLDNYRSGVIVAEHLLSLGHEKFACITGPLDIAIVRERLAGFRDTLQSHGYALEEKSVVEGNFKYESGGVGVDILVERGTGFSGLWAHNDLMAIGALNRLRERGLKVPGDISLVGLDNVEDAWMARPALTTVAQPYEEMGNAAAGLLVSLSRNETVEERRIVLEPRLVVRDTTGRYGE